MSYQHERHIDGRIDMCGARQERCQKRQKNIDYWSLSSKIEWSMTSNAALRSRETKTVLFCFSARWTNGICWPEVKSCYCHGWMMIFLILICSYLSKPCYFSALTMLVGDRKGIFVCRKACFINPERFSFGGLWGPGITWSNLSRKMGQLNENLKWKYHKITAPSAVFQLTAIQTDCHSITFLQFAFCMWHGTWKCCLTVILFIGDSIFIH